MKRRFGKFLIAVICGIVSVAGIFLFTCGGPTNPVSSTPSWKNLVITNQIAGWEVDSNYSDTAIPFTDATSGPDFVDGGNSDYCGLCDGHDALKSGFGIYYKNPQNNRKLEVFVLDYGTAAAAKTEFNVWVGKDTALAMPQETIPPFMDTTARGFEVGGGLNVYAHISNYYLELRFTDYNPSSLANPDAAAFLDYYNSKIK
jgi:hypothetical protein